MSEDLRTQIQTALADFESYPLKEAAVRLFETIGYRSEKRIDLEPNTVETFLATFDQTHALSSNNLLRTEGDTVDFVFQLTDDEIRESGGQNELTFDSKGVWNGAIIESYLFLAVGLRESFYTRTKLSVITREINRLFSMPAMILFRHGDTLTLAIIRRRLHKRDESRDVVERKVTLIKDIRFADPLRAHIEILNDLSLTALRDEFYFHNFVGLHLAWEKRLDTYQLNERFYRDVANWYFWALQHPGVKFPRAVSSIRDDAERSRQQSIFLIRLLTRLIFCWFLQEKRLIPRDLFRRRAAEDLLTDLKPRSGTYYRAFLQNLFFGTLNQEIGKRRYRKKNPEGRDPDRGITNIYRYEDLFAAGKARAFLEMLRRIPFVNGGLFDCLDVVFKKEENHPDIRLDDFSEERKSNMCMPNEMFFCEEHPEDLSEAYGDSRRKKEKVRGLIDILGRYKFTVEENTPLEEEIALDPELLGKVFENLLASYNEDTKTTARKALGAFYTPREIVSYMVDESLIAYLKPALGITPAGKSKGGSAAPSTADKEGTPPADPAEQKLRALFTSLPATFETPFTPKQTEALIAAIDRVKVLDPACGSGAFPMGVLHRLVDLLAKLDPNNRRWKERQLAKVQFDRSLAERMQDDEDRETALREITAREEDIKRSFDDRFHQLDFARKLYLIENCIYGVDILPIACQIAKLRFFIALIVDQNLDTDDPNVGFRPLPNLETKIVAADTLIPIEKPEHQMDLLDMQVRPLRRELEQVRHDHFNARSPDRKAKCRKRDAELRAKIAEMLEQNGMPADTAHALAAWDPYDQNHAAKFFDPEWMFGIPVGKVRITDKSPATLRGNLALVNDVKGQMELAATGVEVESGFDIAIGNPPYVRIQTLKQQDPKQVALFKERYEAAKKGNYDLYVVFVECGLNMLSPDGQLAFILPHKFFNAQYGEPLRGLLASGRNLRHVVHFGDQQIFPGATNYVCLLFLSKAGADECRFIKVDDINEWLAEPCGTEGTIASQRIEEAEWKFVVGRSAKLFEKLLHMPLMLKDVTSQIAQGIRTSANEVYVLDLVADESGLVTAYSKQLGGEVTIERQALLRFLQGRDIKPFSATSSGKVVLMPYRIDSGRMSLIHHADFERMFPHAWAYLNANRDHLEGREAGRLRGKDNWYGFIYPKNLNVMLSEKILVPDIANRASFALDAEAEYAFTSGYGVTRKKDVALTNEYLVGLLNSRLLDLFWKHGSTPLRGGFFRYFTQYIEQLPIRPIEFSDKAEKAEHDAIVKLVEKITAAKKADPNADTAAWEREIDERVYRLYGLTKDEIAIVEGDSET